MKQSRSGAILEAEGGLYHMGIFMQHLGEVKIPEKHRAEYAQQALKLLRAGGMMTVEPVQLSGHKLYLLSPPELDEEGKAIGHYNYLDENSGERWCLNAKDGWFGCGKVVGRCFYRTVAAVHILTSFWSTAYTATIIDGYLIREKDYIGWINYVLGAQYTNYRATQMWEIGKLLHLDDDSWVSRNSDIGHLLEDFPSECVDRDQTEAYLAAYHFDELCSVLPPLTDKEREELLRTNTVTVQLIYNHLQKALREYHQDGGTLAGAKKCLIVPSDEKWKMIRQQKKGTRKSSLPFAFFMTPPAVSVACIAKEFDTAFWEIWDEIGEQIPDGLHFDTPEPCPAVAPLPTWKVLGVAPDDLAYYWTPDSGMRFSDAFQKRLTEWRSELDSMTESIPPQDFLKTLADSVAAGGHIFFRDTFYEFISRQAEPRIQAAVLLMGRLAEREDENLKRFHAVLGNSVLRRQVFDF